LTGFAHWQAAIDVMRSGMLMSQFQALQHDVTMAS
jgi:hypothetical protein